MNQPALLTATALLAASATSAWAHSDIGIELHEGHIDVLSDHAHEDHEDGDDHAHAYDFELSSEDDHAHDGLRIFEADFGDIGGGLDSTDDPGFNAIDGALNPGMIIGYYAAGPLQYHNGTDFAPTSAVITMADGLGGSDVNISVVNGITGFIGDADAEGGLHAHLDYDINTDAPVGAYMVELKLSAHVLQPDLSTLPDPTIEDSGSFYIVFNRGLDETTFHESFEAFEATLVPEPTSALLLAGAGLIVVRRRRRA